VLDPFEELVKRGRIQVLKDFGEKNSVEVILRKREAGVIV
jgi:hypothetical protein